MRITTNMLTDQVAYNMQRSIRRYMDIQNQFSSGRRINTPSDDPVGTQRDLMYRTELAKGEQYRKNIDQGQSWMQSYDSILCDLKDLFSSSKEISFRSIPSMDRLLSTSLSQSDPPPWTSPRAENI